MAVEAVINHGNLLQHPADKAFIKDSKGVCRDIIGIGRWGTGDVELFFEHTSEIDDMMELIEQSYRMQAD